MKGQAILAVLLIMAVVVTVVLSVVSYSITDITITTKEEDSLRAFSAAEAGVERVLVGELVPEGDNPVDTGGPVATTYNVSIKSSEITSGLFVYPETLSSGESATIWLVSHGDDYSLTCTGSVPCFRATTGEVRICWGSPGSSPEPALQIGVFYAENPGNYETIRAVYDAIDPMPSRRSLPLGNGFNSPDGSGCTIAGRNFAYFRRLRFGIPGLAIPAASYTARNGLLYLRLTPLYNTTPQPVAIDANVGAGANSGLPAQGKFIESTGKSGEVARKVQVFRLYPDSPDIFSGVYSPLSLVKN